MGVVPFVRPGTPAPADPQQPVAADTTDDDLDVRRQELNRLLDEDEDTPFQDPWPDHLHK
jgi:hypothetical protein